MQILLKVCVASFKCIALIQTIKGSNEKHPLVGYKFKVMGLSSISYHKLHINTIS